MSLARIATMQAKPPHETLDPAADNGNAFPVAINVSLQVQPDNAWGTLPILGAMDSTAAHRDVVLAPVLLHQPYRAFPDFR